MARIISRIDYLELFNETWLRVREAEIKGAIIVDYRNYFFMALRNNSFKTKKDIFIFESGTDQTPSEAFLIDWINEETFNEDDLFHKNIITLAISCKSKRDAARFAQMNKNEFNKHLECAKQKVKDDYFRTTTVDFFDFDSLV